MEAGILFGIGIWVLMQEDRGMFHYIVGTFIVFVSFFY